MRQDRQQEEEERRVFYLGMTRAEETLHLLERRDAPHPFLSPLKGAHVCRRAAADPEPGEFQGLDNKYALLGMCDLYLGYAGRFPKTAPFITIWPNWRRECPYDWKPGRTGLGSSPTAANG